MNYPPLSRQLLAKSCWMIWLSWLRFEQIENSDDEVVRNVAIYNGTLQSFVVVQSYFSRTFAKSFLTKLARQLLDNASPARAGMTPSIFAFLSQNSPSSLKSNSKSAHDNARSCSDSF